MREEPLPTILPPAWYHQPGARLNRTLGRVLWLGLVIVLIFAA